MGNLFIMSQKAGGLYAGTGSGAGPGQAAGGRTVGSRVGYVNFRPAYFEMPVAAAVYLPF